MTSSSSDPTRTAQDGDHVAVHYTGTLDDGSQFDSSAGRDPLEFVVGSGQVIVGFDHAVRGLAEGESRSVRMEASDAYGERDDNLVVSVPASQAPAGLSVGDQVAAGGRPATVVSVDSETVTIDANHQLAGEALTFDVELVRIS
ncbi:MAG: FKBP-type peptidyl-prolyl cis-trans isomerase [Actinomycetota bacterium]|nr:FKBP-type peptidyl-prolyl cis-trans isomerase [Actinomycetota bacterium]